MSECPFLGQAVLSETEQGISGAKTKGICFFVMLLSFSIRKRLVCGKT